MGFLQLFKILNSNMFLFGEYHGTKEMPNFFIQVVKEVIPFNRHINIFLEVESSMQELLNDYIKDNINYKVFVKECLKKRMYNKEHYDGRGTKDFFKIFNLAKEYKKQISIYFTISGNKKLDNRFQEYENDMKDTVCKYYDKNAINFYYAGANHVVTNKVLNTNQWKLFTKDNYIPCGYLIKQEIPCTVSIKIQPLSGKIIALTCKIGKHNEAKVSYHKLENHIKEIKTYNKFIKANNDAYDYYYYIKRISPSYKLR